MTSSPIFSAARIAELSAIPVDDVTLARALHVLLVVLWIGGVAFVTTVFLPAVRDLRAPAERVVLAERRFANQARVTTALTGLSGV